MVGDIVIERKILTCPSWESNPGHWINRQTLYYVALKAGFYVKAVEVYYIPSPVTVMWFYVREHPKSQLAMRLV